MRSVLVKVTANEGVRLTPVADIFEENPLNVSEYESLILTGLRFIWLFLFNRLVPICTVALVCMSSSWFGSNNAASAVSAGQVSVVCDVIVA